MNSKAFVALFFNAAFLVAVNGQIGAVVTGATVALPLLASTAGVWPTAIAALGAAKLIAAGIITAAALHKNNRQETTSYAAPAESYAAPADSYGAPAASYGAPAASYGAPASSYDAPSSGYGHPRVFRQRRYQRSAEEVARASPDAVFNLVASMDTMNCGKLLICELEAKNEADLASDEILMLSLFSDSKDKKPINPASSKAEYDLAAALGLASKDTLVCRQRYSTCPFTADEMMKALRDSEL